MSGRGIADPASDLGLFVIISNFLSEEKVKGVTAHARLLRKLGINFVSKDFCINRNSRRKRCRWNSLMQYFEYSLIKLEDIFTWPFLYSVSDRVINNRSLLIYLDFSSPSWLRL